MEKKKPCRICTELDEFRRSTPHVASRLHTDTNSTEAAIVAKNITKRILVSGNATVR
jgi:hypothetical protein